jgi:DHA1 family multidrug resistance protein-like MFS transporter
MSKFIRDTSFGQFVRLVTRNQVLQFPEERRDFQLQDSYIRLLEAAELRSKDGSLSASSQNNKDNGNPWDPTLPDEKGSAKSDEKAQIDDPFEPKVLEDGTIIVNWYGPDDPANPQNWTTRQKLVPTLIVNAYTFACLSWLFNHYWKLRRHDAPVRRFSTSRFS